MHNIFVVCKFTSLPPAETGPWLTLAVVVPVDVKGVEKLIVVVSHEVHRSRAGFNDSHDLKEKQAGGR